MLLVRRLLLATVVALLSLELVLQVGALVVHWTVRTPATTGGDGPSILCVGDSYTYGQGSSAADKSYPAVMQTLLRGRTPQAPKVVNAGWPGQNSRDVLSHLEQQLEVNRPQLVFILVGLNDSWTRPERLDLDAVTAEGGSGWHWRWRTGRLLQVVFGGRTAAPAAPVASEDKSLLDQIVDKVKQGDSPAAIALLEKGIADDPTNPEYRQGLVLVHTLLGQREQAAAALAWLQRQWRERPDRKVAEAYAVALASAGERQRSAEVARDAAERYPDCSALWWLVGQGHYDAGDLAAAEQAFDRALATAEPGNTKWRADRMRDGARASCARDTCKAVRLLVSSLQLDGDVEKCRIIVEGAAARFPLDAVRQCLAGLDLSGKDEELAQRLFAASWPGRSSQFTVLAFHLRAIVERCRAHGAQPVLMTYPIPDPELLAVQQEIARSMSVELVNVLPAFQAELQHRPRSELFVHDGHCNDAGYALMAQLAAATAARLLVR